MQSRSIIFLYNKFFPISSGPAVHGYNLTKEFHQLGHEVYVAHSQNDGFSHSMRNPLNLLKALFTCRIAYMRVSLKHPYSVNSVAYLFKLFGKKLVLEFNAPFEELRFEGVEEATITKYKQHFRRLLSITSGVVVVSDALKQHLAQEYQFQNVVVIPNGGERFEKVEKPETMAADSLQKFYSTYPNNIIWVANYEYIQGLERVKEISLLCEQANIGIVIVDNSEGGKLAEHFSGKHISFLRNPHRSEIAYALIQAKAGFAYYETQKYSEIDLSFYNSPLKVYEYLANGLLVISNLTDKDIPYTMGKLLDGNAPQMVIDSLTSSVDSQDEYRTWRDVAKETLNFLQAIDRNVVVLHD
ncbi:glycosyltransferase [uncultured Paraglaciecola sp.]|uniref:glycosyltransferase n=1 Tax=uncultured Paraglaciecola sp. TaxID=1765024 RepID=UPI0030DA4A4A|tara:strand:+ start:60563 stop:61630 length:1068 start_codon:yes stop_codon:yes gene_type:complete